MMILEWTNVIFGVLAIGFAAVILRGFIRRSLRRRWVVRFLMCSLVASIAGLLPPSQHLTAIQIICILSVYCSGIAAVPMLKHQLPEVWRPIFIVSITATLCLGFVSSAMQLLNIAPLLAALAAQTHFAVHFILLLVIASFAGAITIAVKECGS